MNFSPELKADWSWKQRYPTQSEVFSYLTHVVERFDMRRDIDFNTTVRSAVYSDQDHLWTITCTGNLTFSCEYFIPATGPLSTGLRPPYKGLDHFEGEWYQASNWPKHSVDFTGKRVAVIGTGASGVQIVPMVAHNADLVTVFQRTPNYVLPARNAPITEEHEREIKRTYNEIWEMARNQVFGFPIPTTARTLDDEPDPAEQQRILESGWETGGFRFINTTFADIVTNPKANHVASEFVRKKIRNIVRDPETAELLCPKYPIMVKRPPLGHFYFETFNRPNVRLVDISKEGIERMTPKGLKTAKEEFEFDIIIFAIGFDAITGAMAQIDIRGKNERTLAAEFAESIETHLGIMVGNFPNMFMIAGPQAPFGNAPVTIDCQAELIGRMISNMREHGYQAAEPTKAAIQQWRKDVEAAYEGTLLSKGMISESVNSWYVGANVPGKRADLLLYFGGLGNYVKMCEQQMRDGFPDYDFEGGAQAL